MDILERELCASGLIVGLPGFQRVAKRLRVGCTHHCAFLVLCACSDTNGALSCAEPRLPSQLPNPQPLRMCISLQVVAPPSASTKRARQSYQFDTFGSGWRAAHLIESFCGILGHEVLGRL